MMPRTERADTVILTGSPFARCVAAMQIALHQARLGQVNYALPDEVETALGEVETILSRALDDLQAAHNRAADQAQERADDLIREREFA